MLEASLRSSGNGTRGADDLLIVREVTVTALAMGQAAVFSTSQAAHDLLSTVSRSGSSP
jgi:hypothetical protein